MKPDEVDAVDVLLVDDDTEWLAIVSQSLEAADDALTVLTAANGREALDLFERETIDCVVCDYKLPDRDGIDVLQQIRADAGDLPFILITGSGSEQVASRAISSAVTDYFVKAPERDQSSALAARIRAAVATYRTREALATSRRRFAGLFENVPDPVAIVDESGVVYRVNDAFERAFGVREDALVGRPIETQLDGNRAEGGDGDGDGTAMLTGDGGSVVTSCSLSTADGNRDFLVRRFPLDPENDRDEVGYVFTDVTDHRERQRDLERALALDGEVRELFLSAASRAELETAFCETVVAPEDRLLAVVAESGPGDRLAVRARAGDDRGVPDESPAGEAFSPENGDASTAGASRTGTFPPATGDGPLWDAVRDRSTRYVPDATAAEDASETWRRRAREAGVRSALAVPVDRNGVPDGAFAIYAADANAFDGQREWIEDLVSSLGDAVYLIERMGALAADEVLRVRLSVVDDGPLSVAAAVVGDALQVETVRRTDTGLSTYVDLPGTDGDAIRERLADHDRVEATPVVIDGEQTRIRVDATGPTVPGVVVDHGGSIHSLRVEPDRYDVTVDVLPSVDVETMVEAVDSRFERTSVHSIRSHQRDGATPSPERVLADLTDRQREALKTAYVEGYFHTPRRSSAEEVGDSLSITGSTFLQHLYAAQRKLLDSLLEDELVGNPPRS